MISCHHKSWLTTVSFLFLRFPLAFQKGMKLPGSRPDILRTKALSGPSPVGGAFGGTESQNVMTLDDFELQAAHYNMACANARLGNLDDVSRISRIFWYSFLSCQSLTLCLPALILNLFFVLVCWSVYFQFSQGFRKWVRQLFYCTRRSRPRSDQKGTWFCQIDGFLRNQRVQSFRFFRQEVRPRTW